MTVLTSFMKDRRWISLGVALSVSLFLISAGAAAQPAPAAPVVIRGSLQGDAVIPGVMDSDLRVLPKAPEWRPGDPVLEKPMRVIRPQATEPGAAVEGRPDPLLASQGIGTLAVPAPTLNFPGISFTGVVPPDTVGAPGPNHYIQMVNGPGSSQFVIFDKMGNTIVGPLELSTLWAAAGACNSGSGDPIVVYDRQANRWLMSEFAASGNHLCVYVSQTSDPVSGGWFNYDFAVPQFPDYPKYAVWPDAYYVSTNESSPAAYALDRAKMLNGQPATFQRFTAPSLTFGFNALNPASVDSPTPPPAGPGIFMRHRDDEIHNAGKNNPNQDFLEAWLFQVDWTTPANSTFTGPVNIPVAEFDSHLCGVGSFTCITQPGTAQRLDPVSEVVMWHLGYWNFGSHETLVGNFVVDASGTDRGGVRWFELRRTGGGPWTVFQEGTHSPDTNSRWMGSVAIDKSGNIALNYSVSSSAVFPSMRFSGRLAGDPLGQLQAEQVVIAGTGSQTNNRWGDYSATNVDPVDDCTFWMTNEYMPANGQWRTRIATFAFPACQPGGNQPPVAEANGPYNGTVGTAVSFTSAGTMDPDGTIQSYLWDFGDGTPASNDANPMHVYTTAGMFTVTLTVTDNQGAPDSDTATVTITGGGGNLPPVAEANGPYSGAVGAQIAFSSAGSVDPDGSIASYSWNFGDGSATSPRQNPRHGYTAPGTYTVTLTVTDNQGATSIDTATVTVGGGGGNQPPIAEANGPYSGSVGAQISFTSAGSTDPDGTIAAYSWNFGDGTPTSSRPTPRHAYSAPGTYTATLTVTDNQGATDTDTAEVVVK
jgi:PKD repeat protein